MHDKQQLSGADEAIIVEIYIKALRNQGVRRQLRLEDISLDNLLQRSNLIRQVEETSDRTNHESGHLIESIYNMMIQTKKCGNCGLSHETTDCLASSKLQAKWRKQTGTCRDMKYNDFSSKRIPPRKVAFQPNNNNQFGRSMQENRVNDNRNLNMSPQNNQPAYSSGVQQQPRDNWRNNQRSWGYSKPNQSSDRINNFSGRNETWQYPRPRQNIYGEFYRSFNQPKQHMKRWRNPNAEQKNYGKSMVSTTKSSSFSSMKFERCLITGSLIDK